MNFNEYQGAAVETAIYPDVGSGSMVSLMYVALGANGEAGEIADIIKKHVRDGRMKGDDLARLKKECGDVLWYIALLAHEMGWSLQRVAELNLEKLAGRKERGTLQGSGDAR